jgi:hypothetical protein
VSSSISGITPSPWPASSDSSAGAMHHAVTAAAAQVLGMSVEDLRTALQGGASLADLAQQKGVSRDSLLSAVTQAVQSTPATQAGGGLDATTLAQKLVDRPNLNRHGHHAHGHAHAPAPLPPGQGDAIDTTA